MLSKNNLVSCHKYFDGLFYFCIFVKKKDGKVQSYINPKGKGRTAVHY